MKINSSFNIINSNLRNNNSSSIQPKSYTSYKNNVNQSQPAFTGFGNPLRK